MHPLIVEEMAAERSRALHEQAQRARRAAEAAGSREHRLVHRLGLWLLIAGGRLAAGPENRWIVELRGGGPGGGQPIRIDRRSGRRGRLGHV